jgi:Occludin homology domain
LIYQKKIDNLIEMILISFSFNSEYPPISSIEQRRKYKTEFDKDYAEYLQLHAVMEKARSRFKNLKDELKKVHPSDKRKNQVNYLLTLIKQRK